MKTFRRIMVATDLTPASAPAFREAVDMASDMRAELMIVHAYEPPNVGQAVVFAPGLYDDWDKALREAAEKKLSPMLEEARAAGVEAHSAILIGPPGQTIAASARDNRSDLLVMGTHGRKGVARFVLGSVASQVIASSPCPVLTVRAA